VLARVASRTTGWRGPRGLRALVFRQGGTSRWRVPACGDRTGHDIVGRKDLPRHGWKIGWVCIARASTTRGEHRAAHVKKFLKYVNGGPSVGYAAGLGCLLGCPARRRSWRRSATADGSA